VQSDAAAAALVGTTGCGPAALDALAGAICCEPFQLTTASAKSATTMQSIFITAPSLNPGNRG
jgi:hypothetical protein